MTKLTDPSSTKKQINTMVYESDTEVIKKCQRGDQEAFQKIVSRYQDKAVWVAYQMVGNYEEARDISQEAFIRVYKSIHKFNLRSNFYTWLYRIVVNLCIDHLRKQGQRSKPVSIDDIGDVSAQNPALDKNLEKVELLAKIYKVLDQMPEKYRAIILLRDIENYDCKEVAAILGCNHNTVRWRLFRGRQIFKDLWEKQEGGRPPL